MIIFTLDFYSNDNDVSKFPDNTYPYVNIYDENAVDIDFKFIFGTNCNISYYKDEDYALLSVSNIKSDIHNTELFNLVEEILGLYNVEYDRELFNSYILNLHNYIIQFQEIVKFGYDRFINLDKHNKGSDRSE